jgi:hypothetical protein
MDLPIAVLGNFTGGCVLPPVGTPMFGALTARV